ncbi:MAG TPA: RelA/SpoT family protein [Spirochaetota bacterium]|nr:RelA/SpoT family protein [Spirochaetota bacterium]HOS33410.1 RelA/SpoT family protein [Spirochaetota bacterium]HOS56444.1 RelA/SpoT family protein [Spirochaetota bacterium]HQF78249.1 RelA/SpoT family protein [Spirochaetota bacterium]HQH30907.1 RelA/SpoT family protein [Spirochaetota bacterium]
MQNKEKLLEQLKTSTINFEPKDKETILNAVEFAEKCHKDQLRASGEEYIIHPISVALNLINMGADVEMIIAGILHDVVEDSPVTYEEITKIYGEKVANLVDGVTKISKLKASNKSEQNAETIRKMLFAMIKDIRVIIIKFADKLHNMQTLEYLPKEKIKRIANETLDIYAPLAGRIGMGVIKNELENLALKSLKPDIYDIIDDYIVKNEMNIETTLDEITKVIKCKLGKKEIPFAIKSRPKHYYSIYKKMRKYDKKIDEIFDLFGVRIITDTIDNCYFIFGIVHSIWMPIPGRFKDYISSPKHNGYRSLHTTVLVEKRKAVEIQIRTEEMDKVNEYGVAAHWFYKEDSTPKVEDFDWLKNLMEFNKEGLSWEDYYNAIRDDMLKEEIYIFTPKGDIIELPKGSTPLDFAFKIHTDVGYRCKGAKANGNIISLNTELNNGDVVDILTGAKPNVKLSWLAYVKTNHAKRKIKYALSQINQEPQFTKKKETKEELKEDNKDKNIAIEKKTQIKKVKSPKIAVEINGEKNLLFNFAKCCNPSHKDDIIGFVSRGRGIIIHKADCKSLKNIKDFENRKIEVNWTE